MEEYCGYTLDCYVWELSDIYKQYIDAVIWLVDNRASLRLTERNCLVSKSTLHKFIHTKLRGISYELYGVVIRQLLKNK